MQSDTTNTTLTISTGNGDQSSIPITDLTVRRVLSKGDRLTERRELDPTKLRWTVAEVHRDGASVVGYTFKDRDGSHTEYFDADTVDKLIDERILLRELSGTGMTWGTTNHSTKFTSTSTISGTLVFDGT